MEFYLVVTRPFGQFRRGDIIEDATTIAEVLASDHRSFVVRVAASNQPGV